MKKQIYLLIGPKGSGKTFIGNLFQEHFHIDFVRVENWVLGLKEEGRLDDQAYVKQSFNVIEHGVREALKNTDSMVFESTGLTEHFDRMLSDLRRDFKVTTIKVSADREKCIQRVRMRDQSIHINVSDNQLKQVNEAVHEKEMKTDYTSENREKSEDELKSEIRKILHDRAP